MNFHIKDIFAEIGNIGTGNCMASLSRMIGKEISCSVPEVLECGYDSVSRFLGRADESVAGVLINYRGEIDGKVLMIYSAPMALSILEDVYGVQMTWAEMNGRMLDIIKEVANVMAASYLIAFFSGAGCRFCVESAAVSADMAGSLLTETAQTMTEGTVCIGNRFGLQKDREDSYVLVMVEERSVPEFIKELEVETCAGS